jgi:hypothetical protein
LPSIVSAIPLLKVKRLHTEIEPIITCDPQRQAARYQALDFGQWRWALHLWRNYGELATRVKKNRLTRDRKWQKLAKKRRIVARKAGIVYLSKRIKYCVFTIIDLYTE